MGDPDPFKTQPLALGEPFKASREIAPVFSTPPLLSENFT